MQHDPETSISTILLPYRFVPFVVHGVVDGCEVSAEATEHEVRIDTVLHDRARLLVAMEDTFSDPRTGNVHTASLAGDSIATLLTVIRACDRIKVCKFKAARDASV